MNFAELNVETEKLGHHGIVAALFKEYRIIEKIDSLLPKTGRNQKVTHGEVVFAMVLQGLGFSSNRLYLSSEFISKIAMSELLGKDAKAEHFNADALARTLDAIYEYGATRFLVNTCLNIVLNHDLLTKLLFIDTTSFSVTGRKYKNDGKMELKYGHSKDHRKDLKQLVYLLASTDDGLPLYAETKSGNTPDNQLFQDTIQSLHDLIGKDLEDRFLVLDSALYNRKFLANELIEGRWITRVPESIRLCKDKVSEKRIDWTKIDKDFKYYEISVKYGGVKQRWIVVRHRKPKYKEIATFDKKLDKQEEAVKKSHKRLVNKVFPDKKEAQIYGENQRRQYPNFIFDHHIVAVRKKLRGTRRTIVTGYSLKPNFRRNESRIEKEKERKGKFVIATNCFDSSEISAEEIIDAYRNRNGAIEGCFRFLKRKDLCLNQIYLKRESRIESMMIIMTFILFVNNLAQKKIRGYLSEHDLTVPNQKSHPTGNPTFKWISYMMRDVQRVWVYSKGNVVHACTKGLLKGIEPVIRAFGNHALEIYGFI